MSLRELSSVLNLRDYMNLKGTVAADEVYTTGFLPKR